MTSRYTGGYISSTEIATDSNTASGVFTLSEAGAKTGTGNFPTGRWTPQYSLRLRRSNNAFLTRVPSAAGNRTTWTWSGWVKLGNNSGDFGIFHAGSSDVNRAALYWDVTGQKLHWGYRNSSTWVYYFDTVGVFRDPTAWYHIVLVFDTTNSVAVNRNRIYVNGVKQQIVETGTCSQNDTSQINSTDIHSIGANFYFWSASNSLDGYITEVNFIDGQALDVSNFGTTDPQTGAWIPKLYTGTYGTNGFYLPFNPNTNLTLLDPKTPNFYADFLVVAGGGGGGAYNGGGGGGGGLRSSVTATGGGATLESSLGLVLNTPYRITVGAGGAGQNGATLGVNGYPSVFASVTSAGGGHGGGYSGSWLKSTTGGCGGGGAYADTYAYVGSPGGAGNGFSGGNGDQGTNAGGGGGTAQAGGNATASVGGKGGDGTPVSITGSSVTYGGGGGGAGYPAGGGSAGAGGTGGGANGGANSTGGNGTVNLGGGGGGSQDTATPPARAGGNGGSGVVIIKIPNTRTATFSAGVTSSMSTAVAGYKIYTVTATSTTSETVTFS